MEKHSRKLLKDLDNEVLDYLKEMHERPDNIHMEDTAISSLIGRKKVDIFDLRENIDKAYCYNDLELLKKIDNSLPFPTPYKLFFYVFYNPYILAYDEFFNFVKTLQEDYGDSPLFYNNYKTFDFWKGADFSFEEMIRYKYEDSFATVGNSLFKISEVRDFLYGEESKIDYLNTVFFIDNFLNSAKNNETYTEYYEKFPEPNGVFKEDGTVDFNLFYSTKVSYTLHRKIKNERIWKNINGEILDRLKSITKYSYMQLFCNTISFGETLEALNYVVDIHSKKKEKNDLNEEINTLIKLILNKTEDNNKNSNMFKVIKNIERIMERYVYFYGKKNVVSIKILKDLVKVLVENKDKLSIYELLSLVLALQKENIYTKDGNIVDAAVLLFDLMKEDIVGTAKLIEYIILFSDKELPTISQWKEVRKNNFFNSNPSFVLDFITDFNNESRDENIDLTILLFRESYKDKVF